MALPTSIQNAAYTEIVKAIQGNPVLAANVKTVQTWTGEEIIPPSGGSCPYIRLTPSPAGGQRWASTTFVPEPLLIEVETAVEGGDVREAMDVWEALLRALFPTDRDEFNRVWGRFFSVGIKLISPTQGAAGIKKDSTGLYVLGKGTLKVDLAIVLKNPAPQG